MNRIRYNTSYRTSLKDKILDSAIALFHERGVKAVKMDDIANCLSISKRTLYEIYDNKEDLLFECVKTSFEHSEKELHDSVENADNVMDILLRIYRLKMNLLRKTHPSFYCELEKYPKILEYFEKHAKRYYMTKATYEYIHWCLERYRDLGFKGLKKKDTKAMYAEITSKYPKTEMIDSMRLCGDIIPA